MALEGRHEKLEEAISKIKDPAIREAFQEMRSLHQEEVSQLKQKVTELESGYEAAPEKKTMKEKIEGVKQNLEEKAINVAKKSGELYRDIKSSEKVQQINSRIDSFKEKAADFKKQVERVGAKVKDSSVYLGRAIANAPEKTKATVLKGIEHTSNRFKEMVQKVQTIANNAKEKVQNKVQEKVQQVKTEVNKVKDNVKQKQDTVDTHVKATKEMGKQAVQSAKAKTGALYDEIRKKPAMLELRDRMNKFKAKAISMGRSLKKAGIKVADAAAYTGRAIASTPAKTKEKVQAMVNSSNEKFKDAVQKTEEIAKRVKENYQVAQKNIEQQKQVDRQKQKDQTMAK